MILTEDDAHMHRCPARVNGNGELGLCVATCCRAWRWVDAPIQLGEYGKCVPGERVGYCGLAGKP